VQILNKVVNDSKPVQDVCINLAMLFIGSVASLSVLSTAGVEQWSVYELYVSLDFRV